MVSKAKIKFVKALAIKKNRKDAGVFVAEGSKSVAEVLSSNLDVKEVFAVNEWLAEFAARIPPATLVHEVSESDLARMSELTTAHAVVAVVAVPDVRYDADALANHLVVGLEDLQDPGNLGAIIRLCDWFGIGDIVASRATVDCFNAKVVQATMGSIGRVRVHYRDDLVKTFDELRRGGKTIYAATLTGDDLYRSKRSIDSAILFGNESRGLSEELLAISTHQICTPRFPGSAAESLNVATAAAIVCSEFRR
jgi:TrmH family RNA methyltransferase